MQLEALRRFDFDSLLFPLNFKLWADEDYRRNAQALLEMAADRDIGTMVIKAWAKQPWGQRDHEYHTWYEPFDASDMVAKALHFALSQPVTGTISAGDSRLLPAILAAAEAFEPMDADEQSALLATAPEYEIIFD